MPVARCSTPRASSPTRWARRTTRGPTWNAPSGPHWTQLLPESRMITSRWPRIPLVLAAVAVGGCGSADRAHPVRGEQSGEALTKEQRARLALVQVSPTTFYPSIDVTGTVAFNGDLSTQVDRKSTRLNSSHMSI